MGIDDWLGIGVACLALLVGLRAHVAQRSGDEGRTARVIELADQREVARQVAVERPVSDVRAAGVAAEL